MHQEEAKWSVAEWHGRMLIDRDGEKIGKLQDVYVDVETDEPQFATVKEGFIGRHLTFVPLGGARSAPTTSRRRSPGASQDAPNIDQHGEELSQADESALYHHFELNYTPTDTTADAGSPAADIASARLSSLSRSAATLLKRPRLRLLLEPRGFEGVRMVTKGTYMNNPAVLERVDVCQGHLELKAGLSHLHVDAVQGDDTVLRGVEDLLEIDHHPLAWLKPGFSRPSPGIDTPVGLAGLVGQDRTLIDAIRIDEIGARTEDALKRPVLGPQHHPVPEFDELPRELRPVGGRGLLGH